MFLNLNITLKNNIYFVLGEQGWCSGESARLPLMWPGFDSGAVPRGLSFVVGSRFAPRVFLRFSDYLPPQKPTYSNSNPTSIEDSHENQPNLTFIYWSSMKRGSEQRPETFDPITIARDSM